MSHPETIAKTMVFNTVYTAEMICQLNKTNQQGLF